MRYPYLIDPAYIYFLTDDSKKVRYIGRTDNPEKRLKQHLEAIGNSKKACWIRTCKKRGIPIRMGIILVCDRQFARTFEFQLIARYRPLYNSIRKPLPPKILI